MLERSSLAFINGGLLLTTKDVVLFVFNHTCMCACKNGLSDIWLRLYGCWKYIFILYMNS